MDTNQIAAAVHSGQADVLELWAAVRRFAHDRAYRWYRATDGRAGMALEDYIQVAFLALLVALEGWRPEAGAFLTWYGLKLRDAFTGAAGLRTKREQREPLQSYVSLDMPIAESDGDTLTLADVLPDPQAADVLEDIGKWDALHRAVEGLPEAQRTAIRRRYWQGQKVDSKAHAAALRALRHPRNSRELRAYR